MWPVYHMPTVAETINSHKCVIHQTVTVGLCMQEYEKLNSSCSISIFKFPSNRCTRRQRSCSRLMMTGGGNFLVTAGACLKDGMNSSPDHHLCILLMYQLGQGMFKTKVIKNTSFLCCVNTS